MATRSASKTLVLIPAFNAASTLPRLLSAVKSATDSVPILVVDDGSTDTTSHAANEFGGVRIISHNSNRGKGEALQTGFGYALAGGYEWVMTLDADLQHPPELIPQFLRVADRNRLVIGCRSRHGSMPVDRRLSNFLTSTVTSIVSGQVVPDSQCGMRLIPTDLIARLDLRQSGFALESELLLGACALGYEIVSVPIPTVYGGELSSIRRASDTWRFVGTILRHLMG